MRYCIKQGRKDWSPIDGGLLSARTVEISIKPDNSMVFNYVDPDTGELDKDWADWKKISGISLVGYWPITKLANIVIKTQDAIMFTWRWNVQLNCFEFALYTHRNGATRKFERADQVIRVPYRPDNKYGWSSLKIVRDYSKEFNCYLTGPDGIEGPRIYIESSFVPKFYSRIGMYYGGANNSPGKWGGAAPKYMECDVNFIKK